MSLRDGRYVQTEVSNHQETDKSQYQKCLRLPLYVRRFEKEPAKYGDDHHEQHDQRGYVTNKRDGRIEHCAKKTEAEFRKDARNDELDIYKQLEEHEAPEEKEVIDTEGFLDNPFLTETKEQKAFQPVAEVVEPGLRFSEEHHDEEPEDPSQKKKEGCEKEHCKDNRLNHRHTDPSLSRFAGRRIFYPFQFIDKTRYNLEHVAHDAEVGYVEDRRVLVLVNGDDIFRVLHADEVLNGP
jgi:hypothetical protein